MADIQAQQPDQQKMQNKSVKKPKDTSALKDIGINIGVPLLVGGPIAGAVNSTLKGSKDTPLYKAPIASVLINDIAHRVMEKLANVR